MTQNNEERIQILKMVGEGKLTPEEADILLDELEAVSATEKKSGSLPALPEQNRQAKWLRIRVVEAGGTKPVVNMRVPFSVARMGLKIAGRYTPELEGIDLDEIGRLFASGEDVPLIEVNNERKNETVQISVE